MSVGLANNESGGIDHEGGGVDFDNAAFGVAVGVGGAVVHVLAEDGVSATVGAIFVAGTGGGPLQAIRTSRCQDMDTAGTGRMALYDDEE